MTDVRDAATGHWPEILTRLGADASLLDGKHRPCPACGGTDRFRFDDKDGRGTHICSQCGAGDGFELVRKMFGYAGFKEPASAVEDVLGIEGKPPSRDEQEAYKRKLESERKQREEAEKEGHEIAASQSLALWEGSCIADNQHPYLKAKCVKAYGINLAGSDLLIPVRINGKITSLQTIKPDGTKLFHTGGEITGGYHSIKGNNVDDWNRIYIAEGYATGATIREATGCHVAVAFNAGNLAPVATVIRSKLPDVEIVIAGDNDESKTGETKGKAAAQSVGGLFIMPPDVGNDWNDYAATHGLDAVAGEIGRQINKEPETIEPDQEETESMDGAVIRLAQLPPLEYDKVRQAEAKALEVRAATLDASVSEARKTAQEAQDMFAEVEPWPDEVNGCELLNEITATIKRYIVMPNHAPETVALWVVNTYVHDASYHSPMILITSPEKRCGKSTLLTLIDELSNRSLMAANISPAAVYRAIEQWKPTLLIDEADTFLKQNDDMAGVINSGHTKKTAFVIRCDGDSNEPKRFSTWCPKVIAGIGGQRDTLEDRSIIVPLRRKLESDSVERLRLDRDSFNSIQRKCARWGTDNFQAVRDSDPPSPKGLHDRAADNWMPLFAIAELCGWHEKAELAALVLSGADESESIDTILLKDIRDIFKVQSADRLPSQRLCDLLAAIDDRPWGEWSKGRAISTNKLAGRLKSFGIHSKQHKQDDGKTNLRGYELSDFKDAFQRYIPVQAATTLQVNDTNGFSDFQSATTTERVALQNDDKVNDSNGYSTVAFQNTKPTNSEENGQASPGSLRI